MKFKLMSGVLLLLFIVGLSLISCTASDPLTEDVYTTGEVYSTGSMHIDGSIYTSSDLHSTADIYAVNFYAGGTLVESLPSQSGHIGEYLTTDGSAPSWDALTGGGDMTKAVYDTDIDSIVDKAENVDDGIGNTSTAAQVKSAVTDSHTHDNKAVLDATEESFTSALKTAYDWLVTNITSVWKTSVDNHIASTSNPHSVTAEQVLPSQVGHAGEYLTTDGSISSWSAVSGSSVDYKAGTITTDGGGLATVTFNTAFDNTDYAILLTSDNIGTDTTTVMYGNKATSGFDISTKDDRGKIKPDITVDWLAIACNDP